MIMNYKESNFQQLSKTIKFLLDDETCTADEIYELILLTIGESINTHRDTTDKGKELRNKLLGEVQTPVFRAFSSSMSSDTISFNGGVDIEHSEYWDQYKRNE